MSTERRMAKCDGFDIGDDDHGGLCMAGAFDYDCLLYTSPSPRD